MGLISDIADLAPEPERPATRNTTRINTFGLKIPGVAPSSNGSRLDVPRYLQARGVEFSTKDISGGVAYLVTCPFDSNHGGNGESALFQGDDGLLTFECKHDSCQGKRWADFRDTIGPPDPSHYDPPLHSRLATGPPPAARADQLENTTEKLDFGLMTSRELWEGDFRVSFLIRGVLADQQHGVISGRFKSQKTHVALAAAFSIATGTPFLGEFEVPQQRRVGYFCGEGGPAPLQRTAKAIAQYQNVRLEDFEDTLVWFTAVPRLDDLSHRVAMEECIRHHGLHAVFVDPSYLLLAGMSDQAANYLAMAETLSLLTAIGESTGAVCIVIHHNKKNSATTFTVPELHDLSFSGTAEWAGQWMLLGHREPFNQDNRESKLWANIGGRMGHGGLYAIDVSEGPVESPHWEATVSRPTDARQEAQDRKRQEKEAKAEEAAADMQEKIKAAFRSVGSDRLSAYQLANRSGTDQRNKVFKEAIGKMLRIGELKEAQFQSGNHRQTEGYERCFKEG